MSFCPQKVNKNGKQNNTRIESMGLTMHLSESSSLMSKLSVVQQVVKILQSCKKWDERNNSVEGVFSLNFNNHFISTNTKIK